MAGLGRGLVTAPLNAVLNTLFAEGRTRITNVFHAFFHVGLVLAILLVLALLHFDWGWRAIFRLLAILILPYGVLALVVPLEAAARQERQGGRVGLLVLLRRPGFGWLLAGLVCSGIAEIGPSNWLPYFIEEALGTTQVWGAVGLLVFGVTMVVGRLSASALAQRWGPMGLVGAGSALCAVCLVLAALPVSPLFSAFWLAVLGLGVAGMFPTMVGWAGDAFPQGGPLMYSVLIEAGLVGGVLGPVVVGVVADRVGLQLAMGLLAVAPLTLLVLARRLAD